MEGEPRTERNPCVIRSTSHTKPCLTSMPTAAVHFVADDTGSFAGSLGLLFDASARLGSPRSKVSTKYFDTFFMFTHLSCAAGRHHLRRSDRQPCARRARSQRAHHHRGREGTCTPLDSWRWGSYRARYIYGWNLSFTQPLYESVKRQNRIAIRSGQRKLAIHTI